MRAGGRATARRAFRKSVRLPNQQPPLIANTPRIAMVVPVAGRSGCQQVAPPHPP
jgi:hypothetical protein